MNILKYSQLTRIASKLKNGQANLSTLEYSGLWEGLSMSLKFFIWLVGLDEVTLGFECGFVLEKVSLEYRHFWAVLVGNAH